MVNFSRMKQLFSSFGKVLRNEPLSKHTTFGIGGPADYYAEVQTLTELSYLQQESQESDTPIFFLGSGSNLLVSDRGIEGLVVRLRGEFEEMHFNGEEVRAGTGVFLPKFVRACADRGLSGVEFLVGVPGTIGGALVMNAGTRQWGIGECLKSVEVLERNGEIERLDSGQIAVRYRWSSLGEKIILFATLGLKTAVKDDIMRTIQGFLDHRLKTQPVETCNAGSIFKNPEGHFAAELIEKAGLKGLTRGQAQVSPKHANFIVNLGGAQAEDVKGLIFEIQKAIKEKFGLELEPEIKMVGR